MQSTETLQKKIEYLEKAKELILSFEYRWTDMQNCNCGMLVRAVTGMTSDSLLETISTPELPGLWSDIAKRQKVCSQTGLPIHWIFEQLLKAGFSFDEILELEYLGLDEDSPVRPEPYTVPENVVAYIDAWIERIKQAL